MGAAKGPAASTTAGENRGAITIGCVCQSGAIGTALEKGPATCIRGGEKGAGHQTQGCVNGMFHSSFFPPLELNSLSYQRRFSKLLLRIISQRGQRQMMTMPNQKFDQKIPPRSTVKVTVAF